MILRTLITGMVAALCATSALANVPPLVLRERTGNLASRRDADGAETVYPYDVLNRLVNTEYPDATAAGFSYDPAGNLLSATNADAAVSFGYDPMNRIAAVTSFVSSVYSVVQYSHDHNGNRTGLTLPGNKTITYSYDEANRLSEIDLSSFSVPSVFSVVYDAAGNPTNIVYPNGVTAAYTYDEGGRLTGLTYSKSGSAFIDRAYTYNALGQITKRTISAGLEAVPPDTHQHLRHNAADQLTHVSRMDNYENPERWRDVGPDYDANDGVTNITIAYNGLTLANAFTWDYEGRLKSYSGEHQTNLWFVAPPIPSNLAFKYDALGGRVARSGSTGGEKIHVLDQAAPLKNVLVQRAADGTIERYYIYAPGFGLVAHIDANGTARYYHGDHLGSTIALTDASGNVTDQFNYTPYGELMARTGTTHTPYTFCGRHGVYWEGGSLYHMKARYYRADLARFISPDPLGIAGGVNLYAYANGDPIRFLDALGLCPQSGGALWFDRLGSWAANGAAYLQQTMDETYPWQIAGALNTVIQLGQGFIATPQAIGHLGEGTGTFFGDPTLENSAGMFRDISIGASVLAAGMSVLPSANAPIGASSVSTPQGVAIQSRTPASQTGLQQVQNGATVYRQGQLGYQNTGNAQYWSLQNPASTPGYANQMGMPAAASGETWVMGGQVNPAASIITRPAPAIPPNVGGAIEAVTQPGGVNINWFHMP